MKLSKQQVIQHESALRILEKERLTYEDKIFVYENWLPAYSYQIGKIGAFFTPMDFAGSFSFFINGNKVIDLCAGIGILSFRRYYYKNCIADITCVERNPEFVEVGKRLLPEARWICGDVLDENLIKSLGVFDHVYSNPPFGNIKSDCDCSWLNYTGPDFEYKIIEAGKHLSATGSFIIPQMSCPFLYSGQIDGFKIQSPLKYDRFYRSTNITLQMNAGYDTAVHKEEWIGTSQITEIAEVDYLYEED